MRIVSHFTKPSERVNDPRVFEPYLFTVDGDDSSDSEYEEECVDSSEEESVVFTSEEESSEEEDMNDEEIIGEETEQMMFHEIHVGTEEANFVEEYDEDGNDEAEDEVLGGAYPNDEEVSIEESDEDIRYNDVVYPDTPVDTDDEWFAFDKEERKNQFEAKKVGENKFYLGQVFPDKWELVDAVFWYSIESEYDIKFYKRSKKKLGAKCSQAECPWRLYTSIDENAGGWRVRVFIPEHTCNKTSRTKMLKVGAIAKLFRETIRRIPGFKASEIRDVIHERWHLNVSLTQCIATRRKAVADIRGNQAHQFSRLYDYELEIQRSNPGSSTEVGIVVNDRGDKVFHWFYVCFARIRTAWMEHCRKVIGLDGAFLKWHVKGEVLAAVGRDENNRIFPIAWDVVDVENNDNWDWFIKKLRCDLQLGEGDGLTLLTDKQKGLVKAIEDCLPLAEHRMCARHIYANWKKQHSADVLKTLFWRIASCYNESSVKDAWGRLLEANPEAHASLLTKNPKAWCRAYFDTRSLCADVHNNYAESFNNTIREARKKPLLQMLEDIRRMAIVRMATRKKIADKWTGRFTPRIQAEIEVARQESNRCRLFGSTGGFYEIEEFGHSFTVDTSQRECACRQWQLTGIPCRHAIRVIYATMKRLEDHVSPVHSTHNWQETYKDSIFPMNGEKLWPDSGKGKFLPPSDRVMPGRPRKHNRVKEPSESKKKGKLTQHGRLIKCGKCHGKGHNRKKCPTGHVDIGPSRGRGRPRNEGSIVNPPELVGQSQQVSEILATSSQQNQGTQRSKRRRMQAMDN